MNWITKLERKYGRFCIPNLINILIGGQIPLFTPFALNGPANHGTMKKESVPGQRGANFTNNGGFCL